MDILTHNRIVNQNTCINIVTNRAQSGFNQANVATIYAQSGFNQANVATIYAKSGFNQANVALSLAGSSLTIPFYGGYTLTAPSAMMTNPTGYICVGEHTVWGSSGGCCCYWTVPAGVTQAQFQIWGGGGTGNACSGGSCCAFTFSGGNGEYTYVLMQVSAGQTYTLCAGGAGQTPACYVYNAMDGSNSFVCGSGLTCIVSCGGYGSANYSYYGMACTYPTEYNSYMYGNYNGYTFIQSGFNGCRDDVLGDPAYRYAGACTGCVKSINNIYAQSKIPSVVWGTKACGSNICYMCQWVPWVAPDHSMCMLSCGFQGYQYSGCCAISNFSEHIKPGVGGPGANWSCYSSGPSYGGRGMSGRILVSYK